MEEAGRRGHGARGPIDAERGDSAVTGSRARPPGPRGRGGGGRSAHGCGAGWRRRECSGQATVMTPQLCEYTRRHEIAHFRGMNVAACELQLSVMTDSLPARLSRRGPALPSVRQTSSGRSARPASPKRKKNSFQRMANLLSRALYSQGNKQKRDYRSLTRGEARLTKLSPVTAVL